MDKQYLHYMWAQRIRPIKVWYLLVLFLLSATICVVALRQNNITMGQLRETVYTADKDNGDVVAAVQDLQQFVTSHMNTSLTAGDSSVYPPIQLKYTYERLQEDAKNKYNEANAQLYTDAQKHCEQVNSSDFSGRNRVPCIEEYISSHGGPPPPTIPDSLYKFNFTSPTWSPDLAGWSMLVSIFFLVLLAIRIFLGWLMPKLTK